MMRSAPWLVLCAFGPLVAALPAAPKEPNGASSPAQHEFVAHLIDRLRKHAIGAILRLELFTIASGNHFLIPAGQLDEELHSRARALVRLWTRLGSMELLDGAIKNATAEVARHSAENLSDHRLTEAVLRSIEERLKGEGLYDEYLRLRNGTAAAGQHKLFFRVDDDDHLEGAVVDWIAEPTLKRYFVNKLFLQQCVRRKSWRRNSRELEYFKTAKALVHLARMANWSSTVQRLYDDAIDEVAKDFSVMEHPYESNSRIFKNYEHDDRVDLTTPKLFDKLIEKCKAFPKLHDELQVMREKFGREKNFKSQDDYAINEFPL